MKLRSLAAGAIAISAMVLSACGGGATEGATGTVDKDTKAEITYALWDENQQPFIEKSIAEFNKEYPNIKVTIALTPYKQYWTKLKTQADGGNLPDVFWMNGPNIKLYGANDQLASLDDLGIEWNNFPQSLVDLYSVDGKHYGVPKDFDTIALWYNSDLFKKAGVEVPTDDWKWEDLHKAAKTISDNLKADGIYGLAADLSGGQEAFYNTMVQAGGYVIKDGKSGYDDPKSIEGLKFWSDMIADGSIPSLQIMSDTNPNDLFVSGKVAMIYAGTWNTTRYAEDAANPAALNLVQLPAGEKEGTVIHGLANVVAKTSKNPEAAAAFVKWLSTKEAAHIEGEAGVTLPAFNGAQEKFLSSHPEWNLAAYTDGAKDFGVPYPVSNNTSAWAGLEAELLAPGFGGQEPIEQSAKNMADKMNEALSQE
ncbi:ABC transporter, solute-binding protein [Gleimia coleocanis DSM 15436]|uniref:ABC transporter, solute-binding protein n=1 Tax=Gleimia coleocanis DSM 15436 TaxID=525245 RepID=C0VZF9_9ACTO|nr:sugar ABC transporter substrate-binding protein [Gleimia coleocanis]EEH64260.1 ABC transporter, solute-binding protein [Gleimia coleocanis DSM 15436]